MKCPDLRTTALITSSNAGSIGPKRDDATRLRRPKVFLDEAKSVDSRRSTTSQTATGHQRWASIRNDGLSVLRRDLLDTIIRSFARDQHVVHVTFAQSRAADAHEACVLLQLRDVGAANVAHPALHPAD